MYFFDTPVTARVLSSSCINSCEDFLRNDDQAWPAPARAHIFFLAAMLLAIIVLTHPAKSSAQDLGALARQEQARKESLPAHPTHVYTNDDLARPQILVPLDKAEANSAPGKLNPALLEPPSIERPVTSQAMPEITPQFTPEVTSAVEAAPEISLGEVARQYSKQKLARQASAQAQPIVATHVYTNDDLVQPKILTPEDHLVYEAGLKKPVSTVNETVSNASPEEVTTSEAPLGDIARTAYRQQQRAVELHAPSRFRFPMSWTALASPIASERPEPTPPKPKIVALVHKTVPRHAEQQSTDVINVGFGAITVRSGDSLWKLARVYLGRGSRWRALLKANPWIKNPNYLKAGIEIRV